MSNEKNMGGNLEPGRNMRPEPPKYEAGCKLLGRDVCLSKILTTLNKAKRTVQSLL